MTPEVAELRVAVMLVAAATPVLSRGMLTVPRSPGSIKALLLPPISETTGCQSLH